MNSLAIGVSCSFNEGQTTITSRASHPSIQTILDKPQAKKFFRDLFTEAQNQIGKYINGLHCNLYALLAVILFLQRHISIT